MARSRRLASRTQVKIQPLMSLLSTFSCVDIVSFSFALSSAVGGSLASKLTLIFTFTAPEVVGAGEPVGLKVGEGFG